MKVTITADTGEQQIEITRAPDRIRSLGAVADQAARLRTFDATIMAAYADVRRAAGLPADHEPGAILAAWREVTRLVGAEDAELSPAAVVDRVATVVASRPAPSA